mgnify:CR=1 FL=1
MDRLDRRVPWAIPETDTKPADLTGRVERLEGEVAKRGARIDNLAMTIAKQLLP